MIIETIITKEAPKAIGPYSQGIKAGNVVYTSGQLPIHPETGEMPDIIEEQTRMSLENLKKVLEVASKLTAGNKNNGFFKRYESFCPDE